MRTNIHAPTYSSWQMMKNRCLNPRAIDYAYYGGKGIGIPKKWTTYDGFLADMGERPAGLTLDRKSNSRSYSKSNCRWASRKVQARNRDYTLSLTYLGKTQKTWEWAALLHVKTKTIHHRLWRFGIGQISIDKVFKTNARIQR